MGGLEFLAGNYTIPASSNPYSFTEGSVYYEKDTINGTYYGWCAATASKGKDCAGATTSNGDSESSICPRGWKLPTRTQYDTLLSSSGIGNDKAGSIKIRGMPYNFPYAGYIYNSSLQPAGSAGNYWSSTANGPDNAYSLYFISNAVGTYTNSRYGGFSIRCIAP